MVAQVPMADLEAAYQAWHDSKGTDQVVWLALCSDRVQVRSVSHAGSGLSFAKARHSRDEFVQYLTGITTEWDMVFYLPQTFVREGNRVAMFGISKWTNKATGKSCEIMVSHLWRFRDGKAIELVELFDSARAVEAATPDA